MSYFSRLRLRGRLICLVLLAALPLLGMTLFTASEDHRMEKLQVEADTLRATRLAAGDIAQVIEGARQLLIGLAEMPEVQRGNSVACSELFTNLLNQYPYYVNLGTIDSDGNIICSGLQPEERVNLSQHAYIRRAFATRRFVISGYQIEAITGIPVMTFVHPVQNGSGPVKSAVFASLDLGWFRKLELETQLPLGAELLVLDYNGAVLARYPFARKWVGELMPAELVVLAGMGEGQHSLVSLAGLDSTQRLYGITTIRAAYETDLYVSLGVSEEAVLSRLSWLYFRNIAGVGVVTVLALLAAWFGGEVFILRRVKQLVNATRQLASGDLGVRIGPLKEKDELSMLAGSFDDMAESLEQRTRQAQRAETWYRTLVEQIPMITYIAPLDRAKGLLYVSPQIEMILGFSPEEWIQDPELWLKQLHHGDCERVLAKVYGNYPEIVDAGFVCEYRIRAKDGRIVWFRDEAILVSDELDQPFLQGIMLDITQSKHAEEQLKNSHEQLRGFAEHVESVREEERAWIAREIHDELGQILTGLKIDISWLDKKLTSICSGDPNHVLSMKTRSMKELIDTTIQSVRKISTRLRPGILDDLGLLAAVEWQASEYQTRMGIKFEVISNIDGMELDERRSSAVFRIFQELLTNIARHANATKVSISLKERGATLILKVRDNGRGITEKESDNVKSLGILGMRERALLLGGKFSIKGMPGDGTRATVKIPIA